MKKKYRKKMLSCQPLMPTNTAYCNNMHRRLNMQITQLSASSIYLHTTDQSQPIKQLQCIMILVIGKSVLENGNNSGRVLI